MNRKIELYRRAEGVATRQVGETTYLVDPQHNTIHQLNPVGAALWEQLATPVSASDLVETLHIAFAEIDSGVIEKDVRALLEDLLDAKLIARS